MTAIDPFGKCTGKQSIDWNCRGDKGSSHVTRVRVYPCLTVPAILTNARRHASLSVLPLCVYRSYRWLLRSSDHVCHTFFSRCSSPSLLARLNVARCCHRCSVHLFLEARWFTGPQSDRGRTRFIFRGDSRVNVVKNLISFLYILRRSMPS